MTPLPKLSVLLRVPTTLPIVLLAVLPVSFSTSLRAQNSDYTLEISEHRAVEEATVTVSLTSNDGAISGYVFDVCHNDGLVAITDDDIELGLGLDGVEFEYHFVTIDRAAWTVDALLDTTIIGNVLDPGDRLEIYEASYELIESGTTPIEFCGSYYNASVFVDGDEIEPTTVDGQIAIGDRFLSISDSEGSVGEAASVIVSLDIEDTAVLGGQWGICHDSTQLELEAEGIIQGLDLDSVDSGSFAFETVEVLDDGWTASFLFTIVSSFTLEPRVHELYEVTYTLLELGTTTLDFCDSLGQPPLVAAMIPELENDPHRTGGTIVIVDNLDEVQLRRGDVSGNGVVSPLVDALYLLEWQFALQDAPPCMDAADVNDSGEVSALIDALDLLLWAFAGGTAPPDPGPSECGEDTSDDDLGCEEVSSDCL